MMYRYGWGFMLSLVVSHVSKSLFLGVWQHRDLMGTLPVRLRSISGGDVFTR